MSHAEFVELHRAGSIHVHVDAAAAAKYLSRRLLLPLVMLPVLGTGIALALVGWLWTGFAVIGLATIAPLLIKRSAPHFIVTQALQDQRFYDDALEARLFEVKRVG